MSDLRTRVASAIQLRWTQLEFDEFFSPSWEKDCLALADAVIQEIGLSDESSELGNQPLLDWFASMEED